MVKILALFLVSLRLVVIFLPKSFPEGPLYVSLHLGLGPSSGHDSCVSRPCRLSKKAAVDPCGHGFRRYPLHSSTAFKQRISVGHTKFREVSDFLFGIRFEGRKILQSFPDVDLQAQLYSNSIVIQRMNYWITD